MPESEAYRQREDDGGYEGIERTAFFFSCSCVSCYHTFNEGLAILDFGASFGRGQEGAFG